MQQAIVTCTRTAAFGTSCIIIDINWAALVQVTIACCIRHSNRACPDPRIMSGGSMVASMDRDGSLRLVHFIL